MFELVATVKLEKCRTLRLRYELGTTKPEAKKDLMVSKVLTSAAVAITTARW